MDKDSFKTSDTVLASTLLSLGYMAINFENIDGRMVIFFENSPKLEIDVNNYWVRKLLVEPTSFNLNYKRIKSIIDTQGNGKASE